MLVSLVETGSISKTATRFGLTQSAVTKCLKEIESSVGAPLFYRESTGLRPTIYCPPLKGFAVATAREFEQAMSSIRALLKGEQGVVRIAVASGRPHQLLMECISDFAGGVGIQIRSGSTQQMLDDLLSNTADLAVMLSPPSLDRDAFDYTLLGYEHLVVLVRPSHPLAGSEAGLPELIDAAWVLPSAHEPLRQMIDGWFQASGRGDPQTIVEADSAATSAELATITELIAVTPATVAQPYLASGRLVPLRMARSLSELSFGIVTSRAGPGDPASRSIAAKLRASVPDSWRGSRD